jgi:hypothetical protein
MQISIVLVSALASLSIATPKLQRRQDCLVKADCSEDFYCEIDATSDEPGGESTGRKLYHLPIS